ncbi:V-type proton ATPase subunit e 1 [Halotydeus destructor]|nr:V-type proton ATPase subunit e 1 [Halotydeus destructor]
MGFSFATWLVFTCIWGAVGGILPFFLPRSENRGIIQTMLILGAVCCYLMWLITYMAQMNPLFGPQVTNITNSLINANWG